MAERAKASKTTTGKTAAAETAAGVDDDRVIRRAINGKTQVIRSPGRKRWSQKAERVFLETLAATCNVTAAAEAAGFSTVAIYRRRKLWPGFAAEWAACVEHGYARLETALIDRASDSLRREAIGGDRVGPAVGFEQGLNLLRLHRAEVRGGKPQRYDARARAPDIEAVRASILRKIEAVERAVARERAKKKKGEG